MTLTSRLAWRMVATAGTASIGLLTIIALKYGLDTPGLRRATLTSLSLKIAEDVAHGKDPAQSPIYRTFSSAYAFRIVDRLAPGGQRLIAQANGPLLPSLESVLEEADDLHIVMDDRFVALPAPSGTDRDAWLLTTHPRVGGLAYHVDLIMIGDPAHLWIATLAEELVEDALLPVGVLVPAMTLAMVITMRRALRPMIDIAAQARDLGAAAAAGRKLAPLSERRLTREFAEVVRALNAMIERLDHAAARQRQFASDAAHELRTPLAILRLRLAEIANPALAASLDSDVAALAQLVDELLRFAQAEDVMASERQSVDLVDLVRDACAALAAKAVARHQSIEFDAPDSPVVIASHADLLKALVRNLVDNALGVSPPGGAVTVRVEPDARVVVEDRGPGVADAVKDAVFTRHWRAQHQRRGGAGLGLALARRIAQAHGGDIRVQDRPGGGACFVVTLRPDHAASRSS